MTSLKNCIPKNPFSQNTVRVTQGSCPAGADRDDSYYSTVLSLLVYDNEVRIVVAVGKVDLLRSLGCRGHTGGDSVDSARLNGGDQGIPLVGVNLKSHAKLCRYVTRHDDIVGDTTDKQM